MIRTPSRTSGTTSTVDSPVLDDDDASFALPPSSRERDHRVGGLT